MSVKNHGNLWGIHRVIKPKGFLPQAAIQLDTSLPIFDDEMLVEVEALQIDSASFKELQLSAVSYQLSVKDKISQIIKERGKMHNPTTNSGGVFLGTIKEIGAKHPLKNNLKIGDRVVSLVSLTLTPLECKHIEKIDAPKERVLMMGQAILFATGMAAKIPDDLPEGVVLAALDICGAPAQAQRHIASGDTVLVLGLGKAGKAIAVRASQIKAKILGVDLNQESVDWCTHNIKGHFEILDATNPVAVTEWVFKQTKNQGVDVAFHATNVADTEMSTILPVRQNGKAIFFGMNTSFQKATLGAEGVSQDIMMIMGNGYVPGHAELMLNLLRQHKPLREWFEEKFG